jgi:hypothetical protein
MEIRFARLWEDSDGMLQVEVRASAGGYAASLDFYVYPEQLNTFGNALLDFTGAADVEPTLEIGSIDESWSCWLRLRAFAFDKAGHSALEISTNKNGARQVQAATRFSGVMEVAAINQLGKSLIQWVAAGAEDMCFSPTGG